MIEGRSECVKVATSLLAVANTPLFVPTELRQKPLVRQYALAVPTKSILVSLRKRINHPPRSLSDEATVYLLLTILSLKSEVGALVELSRTSASGYRWYGPILNYLTASTHHQTSVSYVANSRNNFQTNVMLKNDIPSATGLLKGEQA